MGNQNKGTFVFLEIALQPGNMLLIQVVGRLVQQKDVRFLQQKLSKQNLGPLASA